MLPARYYSFIYHGNHKRKFINFITRYVVYLKPQVKLRMDASCRINKCNFTHRCSRLRHVSTMACGSMSKRWPVRYVIFYSRSFYYVDSYFSLYYEQKLFEGCCNKKITYCNVVSSGLDELLDLYATISSQICNC